MKAGAAGDKGGCGRLGRRDTRVHGVSAEAGGMKTVARGFKVEGEAGASERESVTVLRSMFEGEGGGEKEKAEEERPQ